MEEWGLFGCFAICFISATIIPFPSEAAVFYCLYNGYSPEATLVVATLGNSLGGSTNYWLGYRGSKWKQYFEGKKLLEKLKKYGAYAALLSWVPFIGDPLMILLGYSCTPLFLTLALMTLSKAARYALLIYGALALE